MTYVILVFLVTLAVGLPVWLRSRTLTALPDGVIYRPFFGVSRFIPYNQVREIWVDRRTMGSGHGGYVTEYVLRVVGADGQRIKVAMDAYRTVDLRVVAQEISIRSGKIDLKGLAHRLVDGTDPFVRFYGSQR